MALLMSSLIFSDKARFLNSGVIALLHGKA
jgi:hypothetical protein